MSDNSLAQESARLGGWAARRRGRTSGRCCRSGCASSCRAAACSPCRRLKCTLDTLRDVRSRSAQLPWNTGWQPSLGCVVLHRCAASSSCVRCSGAARARRARRRRHRLLVRLALLELASRSLECGGDQHVQLQVEDGSMRAQRGLVWDGIFANFERSGRVRGRVTSVVSTCVVCRHDTQCQTHGSWSELMVNRMKLRSVT